MVQPSDPKLKFGDFNISLSYEGSRTTHEFSQSVAGTPEYIAPEIQASINANQLVCVADPRKIDIFCLGLTFLEMYSLEKMPPLSYPRDENRLQHAVAEVRLPWLRDMLQLMLTVNAEQRESDVSVLLEKLPDASRTVLQ